MTEIIVVYGEMSHCVQELLKILRMYCHVFNALRVLALWGIEGFVFFHEALLLLIRSKTFGRFLYFYVGFLAKKTKNKTFGQRQLLRDQLSSQ